MAYRRTERDFRRERNEARDVLGQYRMEAEEIYAREGESEEFFKICRDIERAEKEIARLNGILGRIAAREKKRADNARIAAEGFAARKNAIKPRRGIGSY
jgi:hypothetical protein